MESIHLNCKHDLYIFKGSTEIFFDHVYIANDCNLQLLPKFSIHKIVNMSDYGVNNTSRSRFFLFRFNSLTKNSSLRLLSDYFLANAHKAGFIYLDSNGTIGLITRASEENSVDLNSDSVTFKCYYIESSSIITNQVGMKRSLRVDSQFHSIYDDVNRGEQNDEALDESLEYFYESLVESENETEVEMERHHKRQKQEIGIFHPGSTATEIGKAPDLSKINKKMKTTTKFGDLKETDEARIQSRIKQILFGKNTSGYDNYISAVPKNQRKSYKDHPRTPDPYLKTSKRGFDGIISAWRRKLHDWDNVDRVVMTSSCKSNVNMESIHTLAISNSNKYNKNNDSMDRLKGNNMEIDNNSIILNEINMDKVEVNMIPVEDDEDVL